MQKIILMKNVRSKLTISVLLLMIMIASVSMTAQIRVSKVDPVSVGAATNGFVYSLPQTVIKVDVVYEKVEKLAGPFSEYAEEYLGVDKYVKSNSIDYNIVDVKVSEFVEADPQQLYKVQYPLERSKDEKQTSFVLSEQGCLVAYNNEAPNVVSNTVVERDQTFIFKKGSEDFPFFAQYNKQKNTDTVVKTISIDTVTINRFLFKTSWVDKSKRDKAIDAALQIEKVREARYNLMSGYQEINYGNSIVYMDKQMQLIERRYSELFVGKELVSVDKQTCYFVPDNNSKSKVVIRLGEQTITVAVNTDNEFVQSSVDVPIDGVNLIYYRIPAPSDIVVKADSDIIFTSRMVINQLGKIATVPLGNNKLQFDPYTGNLISIVRQ